MNCARIEAVRQRRYSEVSERQRERNKERVNHAADLLSELEERVDDDTERLETAKGLLSVAGSETRTEGCNVVLTDCLKLLRESAEQAGLTEFYREHMMEMPKESALGSDKRSAEEYQDEEYIREQQREQAWQTTVDE